MKACENTNQETQGPELTVISSSQVCTTHAPTDLITWDSQHLRAAPNWDESSSPRQRIVFAFCVQDEQLQGLFVTKDTKLSTCYRNTLK